MKQIQQCSTLFILLFLFLEETTAQFTFGKRTVFVPIDGLKNLFDPNLGYTEVHYDRKKEILYVSALNGDGAGGYVVLLIIEQGQYKTRMVFNGF